jgi:hypothetical protein
MKQRRVSEEEKQFEAWLEDAMDCSLVHGYKEQPETFELVPKAEIDIGKKKPKFLFHSHTYTPDFQVDLTVLGREILQDAFPLAHLTPQWKEDGILWIDTKGSFTIQHGQDQMFQANRKLLWHYHGIFIAKVVPWISPIDRKGNQKAIVKKSLFTDTYVPESLRLTSNFKISNMGRCCQTIEQFIKSKQTLLS